MSTSDLGSFSRIIAVLRPRVIHVIFIAEWVLFVFFELLRGELAAEEALPPALLPLAFFYLATSLLAALSRQITRLAEGIILILIALSLTLFDQLIKTAVRANLPYQASLPLVEG